MSFMALFVSFSLQGATEAIPFEQGYIKLATRALLVVKDPKDEPGHRLKIDDKPGFAAYEGQMRPTEGALLFTICDFIHQRGKQLWPLRRIHLSIVQSERQLHYPFGSHKCVVFDRGGINGRDKTTCEGFCHVKSLKQRFASASSSGHRPEEVDNQYRHWALVAWLDQWQWTDVQRDRYSRSSNQNGKSSNGLEGDEERITVGLNWQKVGRLGNGTCGHHILAVQAATYSERI
ncbi:hypothetical protein C8J56DRAFT_1042511 [Mycena floridula]|nr:hypothetical protein C8J56DRAFT_1042511 [Mycena floridula]